MNMKHYTSIGQSKRLLELGLNPESSDMAYMFFKHDGHIANKAPFVMTGDEVKGEDGMFDYIPCWSIGALRKLLPVGIKNEKGDTYLFSCHNRLDGTWVYQYAMGEDNTYAYFTGSDINACYDIVCWLLENNK